MTFGVVQFFFKISSPTFANTNTSYLIGSIPVKAPWFGRPVSTIEEQTLNLLKTLPTVVPCLQWRWLMELDILCPYLILQLYNQLRLFWCDIFKDGSQRWSVTLRIIQREVWEIPPESSLVHKIVAWCHNRGCCRRGMLELIALGCRVQIQIFLSMVHRWQMMIVQDWGEILLVVMPC